MPGSKNNGMKTKWKPVPWPEFNTNRGAATFTDQRLADEAKGWRVWRSIAR
jgi:hypothetical protein